MQPSFAIIAAAAAIAAGGVAWVGADRLSAPGNSTPPAASVAGLEQFVDRNPENVKGWKALGNALRRAGRNAEAADALVRAARLTPNDPEIITALRDLAPSLGR
ncbi:MAG: tetratricopeptide repeat protein [Minwuia sp.]|uniref:tetratricopeptide repeat protein n=1 Tax=Minwuia sp. TaxID=2493630 RepID=UPI003A8B1CF6